MHPTIQIVKGIHPGIILERELRQRKLPKGRFALSIDEYPQTLAAILNGRRNMNTALSLRIEEALGLEEGYLMTLQIFYDIEQEKRKRSEKNRPDFSKLRPVLFWDTRIEKIDWQKQQAAVIDRVFERGNEEEKAEIVRFYGKEQVDRILKNSPHV
ncbi:helix-turn-helix transcriptional regulator [Dinghuibacter silviterrae]|uniref:Addiction module HigA family antidote n=1 Tax=Dinghuibacter silviterrae TaxID=1539049 RepID=A0A4R8DG26_9BACT|nr:plasmid maintenance system antidote protein [Dinghuibacter silviterrae]TDW96571.1 addiction module HigA family antidote [Dinghuibacter silviterrae]